MPAPNSRSRSPIHDRRLAAAALVCTLLLAACDPADFRFGGGGNSERFTIPSLPDGSQGAACFAELAAADAGVEPDTAGWEAMEELGPMAQQAFRQRERRRQREWDQLYCRRQAECRFLATPQASSTDLSDSVELCLNHRAQQRVAMGL